MYKYVLLIGLLWACNSESPSIKVGVLHSLSGTMAVSEIEVKNATLLAIDQLNEKGGLLGKKIEPVLVDGASDWARFAFLADSLIYDAKVVVVFGCWTSASRKSVKPVFEKYQHLLFYPVQYEGLEQSPNIVYTGAAPNQQIIPAVKWGVENIGKRIFLVGSDYVFPKTANAIIKEVAYSLNAQILGEEYAVLGSQNVDQMVEKIRQTKPDFILNTINGDTNIAFFEALQKAGISPKEIPTISFSIAEAELQSLKKTNIAGNYAVWNYFQSLQTPENTDFVKKFKEKFGQNKVCADPIEAAYLGVHLWAEAVKLAQSADVHEVRKNLGDLSFQAPEGLVYIDKETQHTWKAVRVGKIRTDGQFDIVWDSKKTIRPIPFPKYRTKEHWENFLDSLYRNWDKNWANLKK